MAAASPSSSPTGTISSHRGGGLFRTYSDIHFLTSSAKANYIGLFKDYTTRTPPTSTSDNLKVKKPTLVDMNKTWMKAMREGIADNDVDRVRQIAADPEVGHVLRQTQFWRDSYSPVNHATSRGREDIVRMLVQEFGAKVSSYGEYINGEWWTKY